ncbi:hypothetical protein ACQP1W_23495 [Spirillospora sp. CA-255316]
MVDHRSAEAAAGWLLQRSTYYVKASGGVTRPVDNPERTTRVLPVVVLEPVESSADGARARAAGDEPVERT